jgi:hypothetical protein
MMSFLGLTCENQSRNRRDWLFKKSVVMILAIRKQLREIRSGQNLMKEQWRVEIWLRRSIDLMIDLAAFDLSKTEHLAGFHFNCRKFEFQAM